MRKLIIAAVIVAAAFGGVWYLNQGQLGEVVQHYVENGEFQTLEAKYSAEQIMSAHKNELLSDAQKSFQDSQLKFYPYLLMEVKYLGADKKPREGVLLWSMVDGEMVLNTDTWEKTHGFEDALNANTTRNEFRILMALAKNKGSMTYDQLLNELQLEADAAQPWIDSAIEKFLITKRGSELQLHLQDPKLALIPQTKVTQWFVSKPYKNVQLMSKKYSRSQIEKTAKAAFGADFTIRNMSEIALPVYSIEVLNADGSVLTSYWNALNGQRITPKYKVQLE